jgi:carbon-monoxide dehydrogenase iron sulfur subunit
VKGTILVDIEKCVACKRCELNCAIEHSASKDLFEAIAELKPPKGRIFVREHNSVPTPLLCFHCEKPNCALVCPANAIKKLESGEVLLDESLCVGCGACQIACPLGIPEMRGDGRVMVTCDACIPRVEDGLKPACVSACRTGALAYEFGDGKKVKVKAVSYKKAV